MLLRVTTTQDANLLIAFVVWRDNPAFISILDGGVVVLDCKDRHGNGPTLVGEVSGTLDQFGKCVELYVADGFVPTFLDAAIRTDGKVIAVGSHSDQLTLFKELWKSRTRGHGDSKAFYRVVSELGEMFGRRLAQAGIDEQNYDSIVQVSCQWNGAPPEFDGMQETWQAAVGQGYNGG